MDADNAVVLTNEAQPPPILATDVGLKLTILQRNVGQKWLVSMFTATRSQLQYIDSECHQESIAFFNANCSILLDMIEPLPFPKWYRRALVRTFLYQAGSRIAGMWWQVGGKLHSRL